MNIDMPPIETCEATSCAYNVDRRCHARAITVGGGVHPACDTFLPSGTHAHDMAQVAGVGACKVTGCRYNADFECHASAIQVRIHADHADCATFTPR